MLCGLLGEKLSHSYSPLIHKMFGDYTYLLFEKRKEELSIFLRMREFDGINVTIPYKKEVIPYCSYLTDVAKKTDSVNTIIKAKDGSLSGYNTDYYGFIYMVRALSQRILAKTNGHEAGKTTDLSKNLPLSETTDILRNTDNLSSPDDFLIKGKKALVLGSGGVSGTIRKVLLDKAASLVINISRRGENNYENIKKHSDARIIVNATPVGMYPDEGESLIDLSMFPDCEAVFDLIYNPSKTAFLLQAEELGIPYENGLLMLVAQAKASASLFTGKLIPDDKIEEVYKKLLSGMKNVVLIGMPGSGKTTVGSKLSKLTGRDFYDCDDEFLKKYGITSKDCIEKQGEKIFRVMESKILRELCVKSGVVIATGGGVVTVPENKNVMRANSTVVWLKRDISLLSLDGRPLSKKAGSLLAMYRSRAPFYQDFSDMECENNSTIDEVAENLQKMTGL